MKAEPISTLDGWKVEVLTSVVPPFSLSPGEAEALAEQLRAAAQRARREATMEAGLPLAERVLRRLRRSFYLTAGGLALLLREPEAAVAEVLERLHMDGRIELWRGIPGCYCARRDP